MVWQAGTGDDITSNRADHSVVSAYVGCCVNTHCPIRLSSVSYEMPAAKRSFAGGVSPSIRKRPHTGYSVVR